MKSGSVVDIPDAVASREGIRETIQPGLPGRWSIWSQAAGAPGSHFVVPANDEARSTGVQTATVRITNSRTRAKPDVRLLATSPASCMPATWTRRLAR